MSKKLATRLPDRQPLQIDITTHLAQKTAIGAKYVPRAPKDGEFMLRLKRPQARPAGYGGADMGFVTYAAGDLVTNHGAGDQRLYVIHRDADGKETGLSLSGDVLPASCVSDRVWGLAVAALSDSSVRGVLADALEEAGCPTKIVACLRAGRRGIIAKVIEARGHSYVVTTAKDGYTRGGEGWKVWEQLVTARLATQEDHDAVAEQRAAHEAESRRVLQAAFDR